MNEGCFLRHFTAGSRRAKHCAGASALYLKLQDWWSSVGCQVLGLSDGWELLPGQKGWWRQGTGLGHCVTSCCGLWRRPLCRGAPLLWALSRMAQQGDIPNTEQGGDRCLGFAVCAFGASLLHLQRQEGHIDNDEEVRPTGLFLDHPEQLSKRAPLKPWG